MAEKKNENIIPVSGRKESPRPEVPISSRLNNDEKKQSPRAATARDKDAIQSKASARELQPQVSARESQPQVSARDEPLTTNRSVMDTARVHTALAALAAERNVLISKLQYIDSALESEKKKRNTRSIKK